MKASVAAVKRLYAINGSPRAPWDGFGGFKYRLIQAGVIKGASDVVPQEWIDAFKKACGR